MQEKIKYLTIFILALLGIALVLISGNITLPNVETTNWNYQQLNQINHNESNYTFTFSGDERNDEGNFARMINHINQNHPQLLFNINGGDLKSKASELPTFKGEYLDPGSTTKFDKPVLFVIGNHELEGDQNETIYGKIFGYPTYYSFTEENSYLIVIDNAQGELNHTQMEWLKQQLNESQKYQYRFVFMHTPLYNPNGSQEEHAMIKTGPGGADALNTLFNENNVTMIFASHIHNYYTGTWGRTPFIISGGAGAPAEKNHPPDHHYILVNVTDKDVTYLKVLY